MKKIDLIPFNAWSWERIRQGRKLCTSRHKRYSKDPRVYWISPKLPWWFIRTYLWEAEGATSSEELQQVIEKIYHRKVPDDELFYIHFGNFKEKLKSAKVKKECESNNDKKVKISFKTADGGKVDFFVRK